MNVILAQLSRTRAGVPLSVAAFRSWLAGANPGERFEYYRGRIGIDRVKGTSSLSEPERRKLNAVADYALALAGLGRLHLLQERHGDGDYSYYAVPRAPARSIHQVPSHFSIDQRSDHPRPHDLGHEAQPMCTEGEVTPEHHKRWASASSHPKEYLSLNPMGSGPFRLEEFKPDDILRVTRNDEYWGEMPAMQRIEAPVILEDATRVAALLSGDLHISPRPTIEDFERIDASGVAKVSSQVGGRIVLGGFNYAMPPFDDKRVRQALNLAVNQAEINEVYLRGMGELMASALPSTVPGHNPDIELYPYDPEAARALLREAGHGDGFETRIEVPEWLIAGTEIVQALVNYLAQVEIRADIQIYDAGTMGSRINARQAGAIYMLSWGGNSTFDADSYLEPLFDGGAFSCNDMPKIAEVVKQGRSTADQDERVTLYRGACEHIHEEAPWIFLHLQPNTYGVSLDHDWQARPDEMIPLCYVNQV